MPLIGTVFHQPVFQATTGLTHILLLTLLACDEIDNIRTLAIQVLMDDMVFTCNRTGERRVLPGMSDRLFQLRMEFVLT